MPTSRRRVLLVQLPIPQLGIEPARGNVPLAAGYLHLYARRRGLETAYDIEILPPVLANRLGDQGLVEAILCRDPWLVGFTCYLWNVERTCCTWRRRSAPGSPGCASWWGARRSPPTMPGCWGRRRWISRCSARGR